MFREQFIHTVMQYRDGMLIHKDRERVGELMHNFVVQTYLRALMTSRKPVAQLPYEAHPDDAEDHAAHLRDLIRHHGIADPEVSVVVRAPHAAASP
jgi:hypothetical protein